MITLNKMFLNSSKYNSSSRKIKARPNPSKYSKSIKRQTWIKKNFSNYDKIKTFLTDIDYGVSSLNNIPTDITFYIVNEDDGESSEIERLLINLSLKEQITYFFFGGAVYDILSKNLQKPTNKPLLDSELFLDSTADIDICIQFPTFKENEDIEKKINELALKYNTSKDNFIFSLNGLVSSTTNPTQKQLNIYYETYSRHLYDQIIEKIQIEGINFSYAIPFDFSEENYDDFVPNSPGALDNKIGNAHLIRTYSEIDNTIRIQLVIKVEKNKIVVIDHLFEILIPCVDDDEIYKPKKIKYETINGINIQNVQLLLHDNFEAYFNRFYYLKEHKSQFEKYIHKPINHVGRILYLLYLFKNCKNDPYIIKNKDMFVTSFLFQIDSLIKKMKKKKNTNESINETNAYLFYYKIKKNNYLSGQKILIKTLVLAFLDILYSVKDGIIKKIKSNSDIFYLNGKKISDVFPNEETPESQYLKIINLVTENTGRIKNRTVNTHIKLLHKYGYTKSRKNRSVPKSNSKKNNKPKKQINTI